MRLQSERTSEPIITLESSSHNPAAATPAIPLNFHSVCSSYVFQAVRFTVGKYLLMIRNSRILEKFERPTALVDERIIKSPAYFIEVKCMSVHTVSLLKMPHLKTANFQEPKF